MNKERLLKLAERLRKCTDLDAWAKPYHGRGFCSENDFFTNKAPAGLIGHTLYIFAGEAAKIDDRALRPGRFQKNTQKAAIILDLTFQETLDLFYIYKPGLARWNNGKGYGEDFISASRAATVVRRFAETGQINWTKGALV